jgi:hypothetical protein
MTNEEGFISTCLGIVQSPPTQSDPDFKCYLASLTLLHVQDFESRSRNLEQSNLEDVEGPLRPRPLGRRRRPVRDGAGTEMVVGLEGTFPSACQSLDCQICDC